MVLALGIKKDYINILREIEKTKPKLICIISNTNFKNQDSNKVKQAALKFKMKAVIFENISHAIKTIQHRKNVNKKKQVIVTGSIGLAGQFISKVE